MKYLTLILLALTMSFTALSQDEESVYTIYMDEETHLLSAIKYEYGIDSISVDITTNYYEVYDAEDECICYTHKDEVVVIDVNQFWMMTGYYYLVDPNTLKLIQLCPIPSRASKTEN